MHRIVMGLGAVAAGAGVLFFLLIVITASKNHNTPAILGAVGVGGGLILSGAMLYCFGAIVEHLIAIRKAAERQVAIFDKLGQPKL